MFRVLSHRYIDQQVKITVQCSVVNTRVTGICHAHVCVYFLIIVQAMER